MAGSYKTQSATFSKIKWATWSYSLGFR